MLLEPNYIVRIAVSQRAGRIEAETHVRQIGLFPKSTHVLAVFTFCAFFFRKTRRQCG